MLPELRTAWRVHLRCRSRPGRDGNAVSTTAGTNCGALLSVLATGWRACRRHVNTCCGVSPCRRATAETTAPGTSVSSTIPALKSSENWRRRPVPVITSSRRTAVTSGSSLWSSVDTSRSPIQRSGQSSITSCLKRWGHHTAYALLLPEHQPGRTGEFFAPRRLAPMLADRLIARTARYQAAASSLLQRMAARLPSRSRIARGTCQCAFARGARHLDNCFAFWIEHLILCPVSNAQRSTWSRKVSAGVFRRGSACGR